MLDTIRGLLRGKPQSVREVLIKDKVKGVVDDFVCDNLPNAQGVIIIWAVEGELYCDTGGFSGDCEVTGILDHMKHEIQHHGVPKR